MQDVPEGARRREIFQNGIMDLAQVARDFPVPLHVFGALSGYCGSPSVMSYHGALEAT